MTEYLKHNPYPTTPSVEKGPLPDLFCPPGTDKRIIGAKEWPSCAEAWLQLIMDMEYGGMPPRPSHITFEWQSSNARRSWPGKPNYWSYKITCHGGEQPISFVVKILYPSDGKPAPVIINGDACWWRSEEIAKMVVSEGFALVLFDRTECAADVELDRQEPNNCSGGLYDVYPGMQFGALSAWAWAYHRCVDLVYELPFLDERSITVTGHSRGGKTCLIAGATDARITLINDNASCAAGGATFRYVGDGGEKLSNIVRFTDWFTPTLSTFRDREEDLPFDQHCLLACLAPRPLLLSYGLDDRWSNPEGMVQCVWAAKEAYRLLGAEDKIAFHLRPGGHGHNMQDWSALIDFIRCQGQGHTPNVPFNQHPYTHLVPLYDWSSPSGE